MGFEVLARWIRQADRLTPVQPLIDLLARDGDTLAFDMSMLTNCLVDLALLEQLDVDEPILCINIFPTTIEHAGFAEALIDAAEAEGRPIDGLVLEIIETGIVTDWTIARRNTELLRSAGALIALDDFGVGGSGIRYFNELELDFVKLDRSLAPDPANPRNQALVSSIAHLVRSQGARLIAEGIGSPDSFGALSGLGIDFAQGDGLGRPELVGGLE